MTADAARSERIIQLDGLRFFAFLAVFFYHAAALPSWAPLWAGVDVFFVLSGFVITNNLLALKKREPERYFRSFYGRRLRRIVPAYALAVAASSLFFHYRWSELRWHVFLISNIAQAYGCDVGPYLTSMWSLAVEEQFYLLWPLALFLLTYRQVRWLAMAGIIIAFLLRAAFSHSFAGTEKIFLLTPFRMDLLLSGALLSLTWSTRREWLYAHRRLMVVLMAAAIMMFAVLAMQGGFVRDRGSLSFDMFGYSLIAVFSTSLIAFVATAKDTPLYRFLSYRWIVYLGTISYMLYLIHGQAIHVTLGIGHPAVISRTVAMVASIGFASLSWHFVESPILARKTRRMTNVVIQTSLAQPRA